MDLSPSWPLKEESEVQIRGLWRVILPDDKHPKAKMEILNGQEVWLYKEPFTRIESIPRVIRELNEWKRCRGGKQPNPNKPNPREYLSDPVQKMKKKEVISSGKIIAAETSSVISEPVDIVKKEPLKNGNEVQHSTTSQ